MKLKESKVNFDPEAHTYHYEGVELSGITSLLSRQLFGEKYKGIPEYILKAAAERGTLVHETCELVDTMGVQPNSEEGRNYMELLEKERLEHIASEYVVSDCKNVASAIDKVYKGEKDNEVYIADIKTTSKLDEDYLSWQLGCYKFLFELQNPDCKVTKTFAIWLRGSICELREISVKTAEEVQDLIETDKRGGNYAEEKGIVRDENMPADMLTKEYELKQILEQKKALEEREAELKQDFMLRMDDEAASTWRGLSLTITRKAESIRTDFDKKKFQSEHADLYGQYTKETTIKGSISVRMA